jgi:hypothetical protein
VAREPVRYVNTGSLIVSYLTGLNSIYGVLLRRVSCYARTDVTTF